MDLQAEFIAELTALDVTGAVLPLELRPPEAFYVLSALQLALRHPDLEGAIRDGIDKIAQDIARRLGNGRPAIAEVARMGFDPQHDTAAEGRPADWDAAAPPLKKKPQKPAPENKQLDAPENKGRPGRPKRK